MAVVLAVVVLVEVVVLIMVVVVRGMAGTMVVIVAPAGITILHAMKSREKVYNLQIIITVLPVMALVSALLQVNAETQT